MPVDLLCFLLLSLVPLGYGLASDVLCGFDVGAQIVTDFLRVDDLLHQVVNLCLQLRH